MAVMVLAVLVIVVLLEMLLFAALGWALMVEGSDAERPSSRSPIS